MYKKPQVETQPMLADAHVMLLPSGSAPETAPQRRGNAIE